MVSTDSSILVSGSRKERKDQVNNLRHHHKLKKQETRKVLVKSIISEDQRTNTVKARTCVVM